MDHRHGVSPLCTIILQPAYHPRCVESSQIHQSVIIKMHIGTAFEADCRSECFHGTHVGGDFVINSIVIRAFIGHIITNES
jgi:hypothetical protein